MNIEPKHIIPYLLYKLRCETPNGRGVIEGIKINQHYSVQVKMDEPGVIPEEDYHRIDIVKPFLHPLSDLTKEIEIDGEKFVPMLELLKLSLSMIIYDFEWQIGSIKYIDNEDEGYGIMAKSDNNEDLGFTYDIVNGQKDFQLSVGHHKRMMVDKLLLFNSMYSWYFDIDGLIENNLAIDINILDK